MNQQQFKSTSENGRATVEFFVPFDDHIDFGQLNLGFVTEVDINFDRVTSINSKGIKKWIEWISRFSKGTEVRFHKVPKVIIDQINMVMDFLPENGAVKSFYVPYFSDESGEERVVLVTFGKDYDNVSISMPEVKDSRGNVMYPDVHERKYFSFLKRKTNGLG